MEVMKFFREEAHVLPGLFFSGSSRRNRDHPMGGIKDFVVAWWRLSRVPFLLVGLLPLLLGFTLAWRWGYRGPWGLYLVATFAVVLIMEMTYYLGEWNDLEGDRLNEGFNRFSGGSRVLPEGRFRPKVSLYLGYGCLVGAVFTGLFLYYHYKTGPWTLPLGAIGIVSGFFYSNRPFRWAYRGLGEALVAFCYGWLPIASGFYLVTGFLSREVLPLSVPVTLSVFNLILINEFPDEEADRRIGKRNLVVRFGKERMSDLYLGSSILVGLFLIRVLWLFGRNPWWIFLLSGIPLFLLAWSMFRLGRGDDQDARALESLCRDTFRVNLGVTMVLTLQQSYLSARLPISMG